MFHGCTPTVMVLASKVGCKQRMLVDTVRWWKDRFKNCCAFSRHKPSYGSMDMYGRINHPQWSNKSLSSTFMGNSQAPTMIRVWNGFQKKQQNWRFSTWYDCVRIIYIFQPPKYTSKIEQLQPDSPLLMAIAMLHGWMLITFVRDVLPPVQLDLEHHGHPLPGPSLHALCRWIPGPPRCQCWV